MKQTSKPKKVNKIALGFLLFALFLLGFYLFIALYYTKGFSFYTFINGKYCTGMTIEEANEVLKAEYTYPGFTLTKGEELVGTYDSVTKEDIDFSKELSTILAKQNPFTWPVNLFTMQKSGRLSRQLQPEIRFNRDEIAAWYYSLLSIQKENTGEHVVRLHYSTENGYTLEDTKYSALDVEKALIQVTEAICSGELSYDLIVHDLYHAIPYTAEDKEVLDSFGQIKEQTDFTITYDLGGESFSLGYPDLCNLLSPGDDGLYRYDAEKVEKYIASLSDTYDTYKKERTLTTYSGKKVTVSGGTYGNEINQKEEVKFLKDALAKKENTTHEMVYSHKALSGGLNDLGDTYIEVDIQNQKLTCIKDGKLFLETDVVTGNMLRHRDTPSGVYYIYGKQKNRVLRGPGYASHVNFWMPVVRGVGIHDALWRDEFGGDIYQTEGSHGCINTPYDNMKLLYENIEVGTPVLIYDE